MISLELLTVFFDGPLAAYICYLIAKKNPKASIWMIVLATCELYGGMCSLINPISSRADGTPQAS